MSTSKANAKAPAVVTSAKPVDILQTQPSLLYGNVQPVLLLSILALSFKTLVQDPVNTLLRLVPVITVLQALYCVLCLPSTDQAPATAPKPGQKKKSAKPGQDVWARLVVRERSSSIYVMLKIVR